MAEAPSAGFAARVLRMFPSTRMKWPTTRTTRRPSRARRRLAVPLVLGWLIFWLTTAANAACDLPITAKSSDQSAASIAASAVGITVPPGLAQHQHAPGQERAHCPDVSAANFDTTAAVSPSGSLSAASEPLSISDYANAWNSPAARKDVSSTPLPSPGLPLYLRTARLLI